MQNFNGNIWNANMRSSTLWRIMSQIQAPNPKYGISIDFCFGILSPIYCEKFRYLIASSDEFQLQFLAIEYSCWKTYFKWNFSKAKSIVLNVIRSLRIRVCLSKNLASPFFFGIPVMLLDDNRNSLYAHMKLCWATLQFKYQKTAPVISVPMPMTFCQT